MYDEKQRHCIHAEEENLKLAWFRYIDELKDGTNLNFHLPPSLMVTSLNILDAIFNATEDSEAVPIQALAAFGGHMFIYGQQCAKDGALAANMVQCNCLDVTDEDIKNLIGKKGI